MSKILNLEKLAVTDARKDALTILEAGLQAIDTKKVMREILNWDSESKTLCVKDTKVCFGDFEHIYCVAIGKCAREAAVVIEETLGENLTGGIVLDVESGAFQKFISRVGTHPLPSAQNVSATDEIMALLKEATERDLILAVVSGGGSSLLCSPYNTNCEAIASITAALMKAGANIYELNTVRKHLSTAQGGQLAKIAYPARIIGFVFSDVLGGDLSVVASGPFSKDLTTVEDAANILNKYNILNICQLPDCQLTETPKEDKYFKNTSLFLTVDNHKALEAMKIAAQKLGLDAKIETSNLYGEAREAGERLAKKILAPKQVLLFGGETTVTVHGAGIGGRNQELALSALPFVEAKTLVLSAASDGRDNTDAAGAIADSYSKEKARELGLDSSQFLKQNNSYEFWQKIGSQIVTGRTGSNIADLVIVLNSG
ncbi:MAG: DUF4147 domain-containing protein [Patescibacteria group bacterium]